MHMMYKNVKPEPNLIKIGFSHIVHLRPCDFNRFPYYEMSIRPTGQDKRTYCFKADSDKALIPFVYVSPVQLKVDWCSDKFEYFHLQKMGRLAQEKPNYGEYLEELWGWADWVCDAIANTGCECLDAD